MVSLNVVSLFAKVPLEPTMKLLDTLFPTSVVALFEYSYVPCTLFAMEFFYEQEDEVTMGSHLSSVIADFLIESFEKTAFEVAPLKLTLYMDNTFLIWPHGRCALTDFVDLLNSFHSNIEFTIEAEQGGKLHFLDMLIERHSDG